MTTIVTRAGKGAPLTNVEVDANFTNLNNDKIEKTGGTITANSTDPALKITQTGSGDALRVEDASGDTTPFVINADGKVIVGSATAVSPTINFQSLGSDGSAAFMAVRYSADTNGPSYWLRKNRGATPQAFDSVVSGDTLGAISFQGTDGSASVNAAQIVAQVDGTPGLSDMPGRLIFSTTADGASSPTERMRIDASGSVGIGGTPDYKLDVFSGSIRVNGNARTVAGDASIYFGSTTSNYIYSGNSSNIMAFAANGAERMRIGSDGGVSIGTTAAAGTNVLRVVNTLITTDRLEINSQGTGNRYAYIDLIGDDTYADYGARLIRDNNGANAATQFITRGTGDLIIKTTEAGAISLATSNAERMRIDSDGNVGIGVTPTASTTSNLFTSSDYTFTSANRFIGGNLYFSGGWKYAATGAGAYVKFGTTSTNAIEFAVAANNTGAGGASATPSAAMIIDTSGNVLVKSAAGLGYGAGAGGTVTQATSKYTAVTLNKPTGQITMNNAALAAGATVPFILYNSLIGAADVVVLSPCANFAVSGNYSLRIGNTQNGAVSIFVKNESAGSLSEAVIINFAIIKGSVS